jgi:hypothetical protein
MKPYRAQAARPEEPSPPPKTREERLGAVVSEHSAVPLRRALRAPAAVSALAFGATMFGLRGVVSEVAACGVNRSPSAPLLALAIVLPVVLFVWTSRRAFMNRSVRVLVHQSGVVVARGASRDIVPFDDVDELWIGGTRKSDVLRINETTLVLTDGTRHRVPLVVESPDVLYRELTRHCSQPLVADALHAVAAGEQLTFAAVIVDKEAIRVGDGVARFAELTLVRFESGRVKLFKGTRLIAWRTIDLTEVPHPTVLMRVLKELAPVSEEGS